MKLFTKALIAVLVFQSFDIQAQDADSIATKSNFQVFVGFSKPFALDDKFIGDAYIIKYGAEAGGAYLFTKNFFLERR